jgi:diacylglycerol kinase family enzyme
MTPVSEIVVNPRSGDGKALEAAREIEWQLVARGHRTTLRMFSTLEEAKRWARRHDGSFSYLFCVGGDSTLSGVASASVRHGVPFIPVPFGFGNLFGRTFGHSPDPRAAVRLLDEGVVQWTDVGISNGDVFLSHKSFGFIEEVQVAVESAPAMPSGRIRRALSYLRTGLRAFRDLALPRIRVEADGHCLASAATLVSVANVPTYRGVLELAPDATPVDGLLDVVVVPRMPKRRLLALLLGFVLRVPWRWEHVLKTRARHVTVKIGPRGPREELRVLRQALPVLAPPQSVATLEPESAEVGGAAEPTDHREPSSQRAA